MIVNSKTYISKTKGSASLISLLLPSLIFIINPPLGILWLIGLIISEKGTRVQTFKVLYFFLSLYLGLIMSTKVPISDWLNYKQQFELAGRLGFFEYIQYFRKEPVFYIIVYVINSITFGSFKMFAVIIISSGYFIVFLSLHRYYRNVDSHFSTILFSVLLFAFFNNYFSYSGHLTRQALAGCIFIYFTIKKFVNKKVSWFLILLAIFIHTSSIVLFILSFMPGLAKKIEIKNILTWLVFIAIMIVFSDFILKYLGLLASDRDWLSYGVDKVINIQGYSNTWYKAGNRLLASQVIYFILFVTVVNTYLFFNHINKPYFLFNQFVFLVILMETFLLFGLDFIEMRFTLYLLLFIPFIIPFIFERNSKHLKYTRILNAFKIIIIVASIFRFFIGIPNGNFQYASASELLLFPTFMYFY